MPRLSQIRGFVLYLGASMLDGAPIVAIATTKTTNRKTGNMVQTWIMRQDTHPVEAIHLGADASVCGDCPLRGYIETRNGKTTNRMRGCYVNVGQAPVAVWKAFRNGSYVTYDPAEHAEYFHGRMLRIGAYGDPMAIPASIWQGLLEHAAGHTGYTHQWRRDHAEPYRGFIMASADSKSEALQAQSLGWRTFRTTLDLDDMTAGERECLATAKKLSCADCRLCNGANRKPSIVILAHGSKATVAGYRNQTREEGGSQS